jgi:serine/threonine protein kinase
MTQKVDSWEHDWVKDRHLGGGAQGTTYLLTSKSSPSVRAVLKTLRNSNSEQAKARFQREIFSLLELSQQTDIVPKVLTYCSETSAKPFFVMEYIQGETLFDFVQSQSAVELETAAQICRRLCSVLAIAHRIPILHRDLKPDNIIVRNNDPMDIILVDFGLAYESTSSSITQPEESFRNRFLLLPETASGGQDKRDQTRGTREVT